MSYVYTLILALLFISPSVCSEKETEKKSNEELITTLQQLIANLTAPTPDSEEIDTVKAKKSSSTDTIKKNNNDLNENLLAITNTDTTNTHVFRDPFAASINVNTGAPSTPDTLSIITNDTEAMNIDGSGNITIATLADTGVVHANLSGTLSSSLIVNTDIEDATISNAKLATITSTNTPDTIVLRDGLGNFSAEIITADLFGSASNNVLKAGDNMTGTLNMLTQNAVHFQDAVGGQYVGINAPTTVPSSYTLSLPSATPTTGQVLRTGSVTATQLEWISEGGSVTPPSASRVIYVTQYGNDITGDGSFAFPYASLAKAVTTANGLASISNPITILINPGTYIEDNSAGALSITSAGISIVGYSPSSVILMPNTPANDFLTASETVYISNTTFASTSPLATGISLTAGNLSIFNNVIITSFATGIACSGTTSSYLCELCTFTNNTTGLLINDTIVEVNSCTIIGTDSLYGTPSNTGLSILGSVSVCAMSGGSVTLCTTGLDVGNNSLLTASAVTFKLNTYDVIQTAASHMTLSACTFAITTTTTEIDVQISGAGTYAEIVGCQFNGKDITSIPQATALYLSGGAILNLNGGGMKNYTTAIHLGAPADTSTTQLSVSGFTIENCITDILQEGSTSLNFNSSTASSTKITINDPTNISLAFFDLDFNNALEIGPTADVNLTLLQAAIGSSNNPGLDYLSSLYLTQAIGLNNPTNNPSTFFNLANDNANFTAITTDRTNAASIRLVSDEGSPVGGASALRGWDVQKNATSAELSFNYQNSDAIGQSVISEYTVMQLDGVNNQLQLPTANTQIVFNNDTNLYRSAANVLKTDDNFIVGTLTPNRAVITNTSNQLASSVTTDTELSYLSGVTSSVQTQLNSKVAKAGDTMTGSLQLPAGSTTSPSLRFTGSTTTGLSANSDNLAFSNNGSESMKIASDGVVSINGFTVDGVVHNDSFGNLTSSLITNTDVSPTAGIVDTKLATISTAGKVANSATTATSTNTANTIVLRDASGDFSAGIITADLIGDVTGSASNNVLKAGDTMTGTLILPAGSAASPSLKFTGSTNTGISVATPNTLSLDTNGTERMNINPTGGVTINGLNSVGVVHTDATGLLSTSLIVDADITNATISNSKLASISSSDTPGAIVVRDGSGNFSTNQISIDGSVSNPSDVATKQYVDDAISTGLVAKTPALVVSQTNITISGTQTIDGVALIANDRVLLVGQTDPVENGLWLVQTGAWTRPADFASGTTAGQAYVLILSGDTYAGSSWLCNTPNAIIDTDPVMFAQFSLPDLTIGANVGAGTGQVYKNKTGVTLNFRTLLDGDHIDITTNTNDITIETDATDANTASTIVARNASGDFSAGIITANLTGSASNNVLKAGDSMTGALNMLTQNEVRFQDAAGGQYVGINAPTTVPSSYTLSLPSVTPTTGQSLRAGSVTATQLEWISEGGSTAPSASRVIYVTQYGNDLTGDGSFDFPYASLAKAIDTANSLASVSNPITILINPGTYVEDNSAGALSITSSGISIVGYSPSAVILMPSTPANDFLTASETIYIGNATFASTSPLATGISLTAGNFSILNNLIITNFETGIECGGTTSSYLCELCTFTNNTTGLIINDTIVEVNSCTIIGGESLYSTPANTGLSIFGSVSVCAMSGGSVTLCATGLDVGNSSLLTASAVTFKLNAFDVIQTDASHMTLSACTFAITTTATEIDVQISGSGTYAEIIGCQFNGKDITSIPQATALHLSDGAVLDLNGGGMKNYTTAIHLGTPSDTSTTQLTVSGFAIQNCTTDILQEGTSYLNCNASTASSSKISINDPTNVSLVFFDLDDNNSLEVGPTADVDIDLIQAAISTTDNPGLAYRSSIYSTQAIGYNNPTNNAATLFAQSNNDTDLTAITTDRTKVAGIRLISDEGSPVGSTSALRGWDIEKNATTAELSFNYQNSDAIGQSVISEYTVLQLDGVNNQLQLPTAGTQIVFDGDTNLYRSAANVLKTDDNLIVGTLTPNRAVITNASNQLASSITTDTELSYLSGVTSSVQTQLNSKVAKAGDTMTGTLQLPAGSTSAPSLTFTGSTTTGLSANSNNLSFSNNGSESMEISSSGVVSINGFTVAGVVHNDASGNLSSSLITNTDVSPSAGIVDTKLATISTAGKVANSATTATSANNPNTIVLRDGSGNFSAGTITADLDGNATTATTAIDFSGLLDGEVTGPQTNTYVTNAVSTNTANAIVRRDANGDFSAESVTLDSNLLLDNSITSTVGNITKAGNRFIHNFGTDNTFTGINAGNFTMTGDGNAGFGTLALNANTTGSCLVAVGANALENNTTGDSSVAVGGDALLSNTTGDQNVTVGCQAARSSTTANDVVAVGYQALLNNTTDEITAVGSGALESNTTGIQNTGVGYHVLELNTTGTSNTAMGYQTLLNNTTGNDNTAIGLNALYVNTTDSQLVAIGSGALQNYNTTDGQNVAVGYNALNANNSTEGQNVAVGWNALQLDTSIGGNTAVGWSALGSDSSGNNNTAVGWAALQVNTTASRNTAIGGSALYSNTTGNNNTAVGYETMNDNITGAANTAMGQRALLRNTSGRYNTAIGFEASRLNTTGEFNTAIGTGALDSNTTVSELTAVGYNALAFNTAGQEQVAVGTEALFANTTGDQNTAVGHRALQFNVTGNYNTALGRSALGTSNDWNGNPADHNTAVGYNALISSYGASELTAIGSQALQSNIHGAQNTAVGFSALYDNDSGFNNTAVGHRVMFANTQGINNTAMGQAALTSNTTGGQNTAVGYQAMDLNTTGTDNTAVGSYALLSNATGTDNVAVGANALQASTISQLTAVGSGALQANTTGPANTAVGYQALNANTTGDYNVAIGYNALLTNADGHDNTAVGAESLYSNVLGFENTAIGSGALYTNTANNNTAVGSQALIANTTGNGNTAVGQFTLPANTTGTLNTAVGIGTMSTNDTGNNNVAVGFVALQNNVDGNHNVAVGSEALQNSTVGETTAVGSGALQSNTTGTGNTATGYQALNANEVGNNNTAIGYQTLFLNNLVVDEGTGTDNVGVGYQALYNNVAADNTALGTLALYSNTEGIQNAATGKNALYSNTTGDKNTANGFQALYSNTTTNDNVAIGYNALNASTVSQLTAVGSGALENNTTGIQNTAVGYHTMDLNTTGTSNTAFGYQALASNTTTNDNTAIGSRSLQNNTTGQNTAIGSGALQANTTGTGNTAIGLNALTNITTGADSNVAIGHIAMRDATGGINNVAIGRGALLVNATGGDYNVAIGRNALNFNSTGTRNIAIGFDASLYNTAGSDNVAIGHLAALLDNTSQNVAIGTNALTNNTGNNCVAIGYNAVNTTNASSGITAVGSGALAVNTTGDQNTAVGYNTLNANTTGGSNTAFGYNAMATTTTGARNTAVGRGALDSNLTGNDNVAVGFNVLTAATSSNLTAVGAAALAANTSGGSNTAIGSSSLVTNITGSNNTAVGTNALRDNTGGSNTAVGQAALLLNTTGASNVTVGQNSLSANTTGSSNIAIGTGAGNALTTGSNNINIGNAGVAGDGARIRIGTSGTHTTCFISGISGVTSSGGAAVFVNASGQLGTTTSSIRYKENVEDMNEQSSPILDLRPVSFTYKEDALHTKQFGLIAEEVQDVFPALVIRGADGQIETVKYHELSSLLLNEFIKQHKVIEELKEQHAAMEAENKAIRDRLTALEVHA